MLREGARERGLKLIFQLRADSRDLHENACPDYVRAAGAKRVVINSPVFTVLRDGETFNTVAESVPQIATSSPSTTITNGGFEDE